MAPLQGRPVASARPVPPPATPPPVVAPAEPAVPPRRAASGKGFYARAWEAFRADRLSVAAAIVLGIICVITLLVPWITDTFLHTQPDTILRDANGRIARLRPPSAQFLLGTDDLGRDTLTRLLDAGRVSLTVGFTVAWISIVLGTIAGLAAGFFGGWVDDLVNALVQFIFNIPSLFVLVLLSIAFRPNLWSLSLILGLLTWPGTARQVRGVVQSLRHLDYVQAARTLGASNARIMFHHILPNVVNVVLVVAGFSVAGAILSESALSFLGFGVQVPQASWGNMLTGSNELLRNAPWLVVPPGFMIFITVLCVVLLADGLRDAFDPRIRR